MSTGEGGFGKHSPMKNRLSFHPLGLPLSWQLLGIIVGALIVAQFVTLALTILIPPAPMQRWNMQEVAASLLGTTQSDALERRVIKGPPDISGTGWLISETSRQALANEVGKPVGDVVLAFYTQLPVGGVSVPVNEAQNNLQETTFLTPAKAVADMIVPVAHAQGQPGGPPPGGMPGAAFQAVVFREVVFQVAQFREVRCREGPCLADAHLRLNLVLIRLRQKRHRCRIRLKMRLKIPFKVRLQIRLKMHLKIQRLLPAVRQRLSDKVRKPLLPAQLLVQEHQWARRLHLA